MVGIMSVVFQAANQNGQGHSGKERKRQFAPIMGVELKFRQQIAGGDAQESSRRESERSAEEHLLLLRRLGSAQMEECDPSRNRQRKKRVHAMTCCFGPSSGRHQRANGHCVKRLVHYDDQERSHPHQDPRLISLCFHLDTRGQRHPVDQSMECQAHRGPCPREVSGRLFRKRPS